MKSTRLHLAKGIKLIQRLQKGASLFFCFASAKGSRRASLWFKGLNPNYDGKASDSAIDDAEGIEHGFAWRGVGSA